jgi:hypothetical protein
MGIIINHSEKKFSVWHYGWSFYRRYNKAKKLLGIVFFSPVIILGFIEILEVGVAWIIPLREARDSLGWPYCSV